MDYYPYGRSFTREGRTQAAPYKLKVTVPLSPSPQGGNPGPIGRILYLPVNDLPSNELVTFICPICVMPSALIKLITTEVPLITPPILAAVKQYPVALKFPVKAALLIPVLGPWLT